ncbi:hypothetical protein V6C53_17090 [Desulfocurvibacter africanus]|uniref:hypothetical protein n=1 Tax=Desulfocurvibacter africanus TaxID=873 RepID=UPI002FDA5BC4
MQANNGLGIKYLRARLKAMNPIEISIVLFALVSFCLALFRFLNALGTLTNTSPALAVFIYILLLHSIYLTCPAILLWLIFDTRSIEGFIAAIGFSTVGAIFHGLEAGLLDDALAHFKKADHFILSIQITLICVISFARSLSKWKRASNISN